MDYVILKHGYIYRKFQKESVVDWLDKSGREFCGILQIVIFKLDVIKASRGKLSYSIVYNITWKYC